MKAFEHWHWLYRRDEQSLSQEILRFSGPKSETPDQTLKLDRPALSRRLKWVTYRVYFITQVFQDPLILNALVDWKNVLVWRINKRKIQSIQVWCDCLQGKFRHCLPNSSWCLVVFLGNFWCLAESIFQVSMTTRMQGCCLHSCRSYGLPCIKGVISL